MTEKARLEAVGLQGMENVLRLLSPGSLQPPIPVNLAGNGSPLARYVAPWIAGFASEGSVVIFPQRSPSYPDNTLDDVLRHEVAHVLIWRASAGRPIPRWFNEGLATAAERKRGLRDQTQLFFLLVSGSRLSLTEINRLFEGGQTDQTQAYLLSAAIVQQLLQNYGETAGQKILERVGNGVSFDAAFRDVTGRSTSTADAEFWENQRVWTSWLPIVFSQNTLWAFITLLAILAILRQRRRNAAIRQRWDDEEDSTEH